MNLRLYDDGFNRSRKDMKKFNVNATEDRNKKELEKVFIVLILETLIILFKFKDIHSKLIASEYLLSIISCIEKIKKMNSIIHSKEGTPEEKKIFIEYNFSPLDIQYIIRVVCLILYESSFFSDTYENLISNDVIKFMIKTCKDRDIIFQNLKEKSLKKLHANHDWVSLSRIQCIRKYHDD